MKKQGRRSAMTRHCNTTGKSLLAEFHLRVYQAVGWLHCFIRFVVAWPRVLEERITCTFRFDSDA